MNIKCPHCGTEYEITQAEYGRVVRCEVCRNEFVAGISKTSNILGLHSEQECKLGQRKNTSRQETQPTKTDIHQHTTGHRRISSSGGLRAPVRITGHRRICTHCGEIADAPKAGQETAIKAIVVGTGVTFFLVFLVLLIASILMMNLILLLISFILPMIISVLTRPMVKNLHDAITTCPHCKCNNCLVDLNSPMGKKVFNETHPNGF
ncbi:MAG: hypothetical protein IKF72_07545 [Kiritimatiellae bacterium]|nr:hypothetical protein [Kiritimatiellia bacterium]